MKKKMFSRGLYVEGLRQLRVVGIIFLAILLLVGVATPVIQYINYRSYLSNVEIYGMDYQYTPQVISFVEMCPLIFVISTVMAIVFTFMLYSSFNKRSSSDFYHALPYTRICMFNSFTSAVFTWLAALSVIYCGVATAVHALMPNVFILNLSGTLDALLTAIALSMMLVFGIIAAMSLTGTPIANITCAGLLLFLPRLIVTLITYTMGEIAPIISGHYGIFGVEFNSLINLIYQIFFYGDAEFYENNIASDIYSIGVAVLYAVLAAFLFCRRKSETSGHAATGKKIHHFIRICVGFVVSSVVTCAAICESDEIAVLVVLYIVAVIIYFAYELITQKTFKTIPSTLPGLAILLGLNLAIAAACFGCAAYVHSYTPDKDDIEAIYIENYIDNYRHRVDFSEYALEKAGQIRVEDKNVIAIAAENLKINNERSKNGKFYSFMYQYDRYDPDFTEEYVQSTEMTIVYVSNLGVKRTRNVFIPIDDYQEMMELVQTNDAYKKIFYEFPEPVSRTSSIYERYNYDSVMLSDEDYEEIFNSIKNEVKTLDFSTWATYLAAGNRSGGFEFSYTMAEEAMTLTIYFDGTILPETSALIMEKANANHTAELNTAIDILSDFEAAIKKYDSIYFNMSAVDETLQWQLYQHYYKEEGGKNSLISDELIADLKTLAECAKAGKLEGDKFISMRVEYADYEEKDADDEKVDYISHYATVFLPYPENFEPQSDNFDMINDNYAEEYYKYYEDTIIVG